MDIRATLASQQYAASRQAAQPTTNNEQKVNGFASVAQDFAQTVQNGERTAMAALSGDADPHALVQALAQTELAVETAVTVRDKVVEAYQEILRMPV